MSTTASNSNRPGAYHISPSGQRVFAWTREDSALVTVQTCGIPAGSVISARINHGTTHAFDFEFYTLANIFLGQSTAQLTTGADGTATCWLLAKGFVFHNFTESGELEFYTNDFSCRQPIVIRRYPVQTVPLGACCFDGTCIGETEQTACTGTGYQWFSGISCSYVNCAAPSVPCSGGQITRSHSQEAAANPNCTITSYGEQAVSVPRGCRWVNISGSTDDLLLVDGIVRGRNNALDGRAVGGSGKLNDVCAGAGSVNYTFYNDTSFTIAAGDTQGVMAGYSLTIKFGDTNAFSVQPLSLGGAGTELKALLALIGITSTPDCSCNKRAQEMDANGVQWCKENEELILSWLKEEAEKRGLPFVSAAARMLIRRAIRNAEKKANSQ